MDEIELFTALRPTPATELSGQRERARARLASAMSGSGARVSARHPGRRLGGLNPPARTAFTIGGAALAVGSATVLAAVLPGLLSSGPSGLITSAWAVQPRKDGTVKVTIKDASDPSGLERALRAAGVRAIVVSPGWRTYKNAQGRWATVPDCTFPSSGPLFSALAVQRAVVTVPKPAKGTGRSPSVIAYIHPSAMPKGSVLFIADTYSAQPNGTRTLSVAVPLVLKGDKQPACRSLYPKPVPSAYPTPTPSTPVSPPTASPVPTASPSAPSTSPRPTPSASPSAPTASPEPTPSASPRSPSTSPRPTPSASPRAPTTSPTPVPSASR